MQYILFKTHYLDLILTGKKTQTVRLWKRPKNIKTGDIVIATNQSRKIKIKIDKIYSKPASSLTADEAIADGFESVDALKKAILKTYKSLDFIATIIKFKPV